MSRCGMPSLLTRLAAGVAVLGLAICAGCTAQNTANLPPTNPGDNQPPTAQLPTEPQPPTAPPATDNPRPPDDVVGTVGSDNMRPANMAGLTVQQVLAWNVDYTWLQNLADQPWDAADEVSLVLNDVAGREVLDAAPGIQVTQTPRAGTVVSIIEPGTYRISGTLPDGDLRVDTPYDSQAVTRVILDNVHITSHFGAALNIGHNTQNDVIVYLVEDSINYLSEDSTTPAVYNDQRATLYANGNLAITGLGTLVVTANTEDAIVTTQGLLIRGDGTIQTKSPGDGICSKHIELLGENAPKSTNFIAITGGSLIIGAGSDGLCTEADDISGTGYIAIRDVQRDPYLHTTIDITASSDGIDAINDFVIDGGQVTIRAAGEGIEASNINISGGTIDITADEDALNATTPQPAGYQGNDWSRENQPGAALTVTGGKLHAVAGTDGFDSNGSIMVTGGTSILEAATGSGGEGGIDANGSVNLTGGTMLIAGNWTTNDVITTGQGWFTATGSAGGTDVLISDQTGRQLGSFTLASPPDGLAFTSDAITPGGTYLMTVGGAAWTSTPAADILVRRGGGRGRR